MNVKELKVTKENVMNLIEEKGVYVLIYLKLFEKHIMKPIAECSVAEMLNEENVVIQVTKVES